MTRGLSAGRARRRSAVYRVVRRRSSTASFQNKTPDQLAIVRDVSRSTIDNHTAKAKKNMENDDCFFTAQFQLGILRDRARAAETAARYPSGRLPDGPCMVVIDHAA